MTRPNDDVAPVPAARSARRTATRDSLALAIGTAVSGAFAYAFVALGTRTLGAEESAPVAQLWTYWTVSAALLTFPVQHWIIRSVHTPGGLAAVRGQLPRVLAVVAGLAVAATAVSWLFREQLFTRGDAAFPLLVGAVTLSAFLVGLVRGRLAGARRFIATGAAIAAENLLRVVLAVVTIAVGGGTVAFGVVLVSGGLAVLAWPSALRFQDDHGAPLRRSPLSVLGGIAAGSLIAQVILTGGPVVLAAIGGGPREITELFVALALFRAPYLVSLGLVTQLTGALTELIVTARHRLLLRVRRLLVAGAVVGAGVGWAVGWVLGPAIITVVFRVTPPRPMTALVAAATAVALANLGFTVLLIAREASGALTRNWLAAVVVGALVVAVAPGTPALAVAQAFLAAEIAAFALMWFTERREAVTAAAFTPAGHGAGSHPVA